MQILKTLLLAGIFCFAFDGQAQIKFFNIYTNKGYDFGEGITQLADSSYIITGSSSSFGDAPAQAFLLHVDSLGNRLWSNSYGGAESDWGRRVFAVEGDGIYVAGYTNSFGNGSFDFYFFKTDMSGNLLFEKAYGGNKFERMRGAVMLPDTTFILVGETVSNATEVEDIYMVRLKANGDTIWTKTMGSAGKDIARNITMLNDTTVVVVGDYYVADSLMQKAMVMRMHIDGTVEWLHTVGDNGVHSLNDVTFNNGLIRAVGYNKITTGNTEYSYLYRYIANEQGAGAVFNLVDRAVSYSRLEYLTSYGNQGKFYVAEQALRSNIVVYADGEDCIIHKYTDYLFWDNGTLNTSNKGQDQASQMIPTSDGGAIIVGYNSFYGAGGNNVTLTKIGPNDAYPASYTPPVTSNLVFTKELSEDFKLNVYPNPVENVLNIQSALPGNKKVSLMDASGKVLQHLDFDMQGEINFGTYSQGIYFVRIEIGGKQKVIKVVKQ